MRSWFLQKNNINPQYKTFMSTIQRMRGKLRLILIWLTFGFLWAKIFAYEKREEIFKKVIVLKKFSNTFS